jgi:serine/threonine-protein kinase
MTEETPDSSGAEPVDPWIGRELAGYTILRKIGIGGMGIVYQGHHQSLDRMAAIKFLSPQLAGDPAYVQLFLREARAAAKLSHPNLVTVYDAGSIGANIFYFIMEYIDGRDLEMIQSQEGLLPVSQAVEYVRQAAAALGYAHQKQIIHRDVKPENLMLTQEGVIKVADMGLAKWMGEDSAMTRGGWMMGSPYYISPERLKDQHRADARSDIYSLGATLYHLLTGRVPYEGTPPVVMAQHLEAPLPNPFEANPALDFDICDIIQRMMAKNPDDRFQTMEEVRDALAAYLAMPSHPDHASPTELIPPVLEPPASPEGSAAAGPAPSRGVSAATLMRLGVLALIVAAGWWLLTTRMREHDEARVRDEAQPDKPVLIVPDEESPSRVGAPNVRVPPAPAAPPEGSSVASPPAQVVEPPNLEFKPAAPTAPIPPASGMLMVSPRGKPDAPGTPAAPLTLSAALEKVQPGGEIVVTAGTYREPIYLTHSGEPGKPIRLSAEGKVVIEGSGNEEASPYGLVGRRAGWWTIEGIEFKGFSQGVKLVNAQHITIRNCKIRACGTAFALEGTEARGILVEDVEASESRESGFDIAKGVAVEDVIFRRCSSHHNICSEGGDAFGLSHGCVAKNLRYENCIAYENGSEGFDIGRGMGEVVLIGCIAHHNGRTMWGANFKAWRPDVKLINCAGWATGKETDGNFELRGDSQLLLNCTSGENSDTGIVIAGENVRVINCIIAGAFKTAARIKKDPNPKASCTVEDTLIFECPNAGAVPIGKKGNFSANPKFIDAQKGNYAIRRGSPAAGKGQAHADLTVDAAGRPRPKDRPSLGAWEPE